VRETLCGIIKSVKPEVQIRRGGGGEREECGARGKPAKGREDILFLIFDALMTAHAIMTALR